MRNGSSCRQLYLYSREPPPRPAPRAAVPAAVFAAAPPLPLPQLVSPAPALLAAVAGAAAGAQAARVACGRVVAPSAVTSVSCEPSSATTTASRGAPSGGRSTRCRTSGGASSSHSMWTPDMVSLVSRRMASLSRSHHAPHRLTRTRCAVEGSRSCSRSTGYRSEGSASTKSSGGSACSMKRCCTRPTSIGETKSRPAAGTRKRGVAGGPSALSCSPSWCVAFESHKAARNLPWMPHAVLQGYR